MNEGDFFLNPGEDPLSSHETNVNNLRTTTSGDKCKTTSNAVSSWDSPTCKMDDLLEKITSEIDGMLDYSCSADTAIFNQTGSTFDGHMNLNKDNYSPVNNNNNDNNIVDMEDKNINCTDSINSTININTNMTSPTCPFQDTYHKFNVYCNQDGENLESCPVKFMHKQVTQILSIKEQKYIEENSLNDRKSRNFSYDTSETSALKESEKSDIQVANSKHYTSISPLILSPSSNDHIGESNGNSEDDILYPEAYHGHSALHKPLETPSCPFSGVNQKFLSTGETDLVCLVTGKHYDANNSPSAKGKLQPNQCQSSNTTDCEEDNTNATPTMEEKINLFNRYMETEKAGAAMTGILNRVTLKTLQRDKKSLQRLALFGSGGGGPLLRHPLISRKPIVSVKRDSMTVSESDNRSEPIIKTDTMSDIITDSDSCAVQSKRYCFSVGYESGNECEYKENEKYKNYNPLHIDEEQVIDDIFKSTKDINKYSPRKRGTDGIHGMNIIDVRASLTTTAPSLFLDDKSYNSSAYDKSNDGSDTISQQGSEDSKPKEERASILFRPFASLSKQMATAMAMRFVCQVTSPCERRHADLYMRLFAEACGIKSAEFVPSLLAYVGFDPAKQGTIDLSGYASSSSIPQTKSAISGFSAQLGNPPRTFLHDALAPLYAPRTKHFFEKWSDAAAEYQKEECIIMEKKKNRELTTDDEVKLKAAAFRIEQANDALVHCLRILSKLLHYYAISCETVGEIISMLIQESNDFLILLTCVNFRSLSLSPAKPKYRDFCVYPYAHRYVALFVGFCLKESTWFRRFINQTAYETGGYLRENVIRELRSAKRLLDACLSGGSGIHIQAWSNPKGFMSLMEICLENIELSGNVVSHSRGSPKATNTASRVHVKNITPNTLKTHKQSVLVNEQHQNLPKKDKPLDSIIEKPSHINVPMSYNTYHPMEFIRNPALQTSLKTQQRYDSHPVHRVYNPQQPFCDHSINKSFMQNTVSGTGFPSNKGNFGPPPFQGTSFNPNNFTNAHMFSNTHLPYMIPQGQRQPVASSALYNSVNNHHLTNFQQHNSSTQSASVINQQVTNLQHQSYHMTLLQETINHNRNNMSLHQSPYFHHKVFSGDSPQQPLSTMPLQSKEHQTQALVSKLTDEEKNQLLISLLQVQQQPTHNIPTLHQHQVDTANQTNVWQSQATPARF